MRSIFFLFITQVCVSIYTSANPIILGLYWDDAAVGLFTTATKFNGIALSLITSLGVVLLPRLSYCWENSIVDEYQSIIKKSISFIYFTSFPAVIIMMFSAHDILLLLSGEQYIAATTAMQISVPCIFFISMTNFIGRQILYTKGKEVLVFYSVLVGAVSSLLLFFIFIPKHGVFGAAFVLASSEFSVLIAQVIIGKKYIEVPLFEKYHFKYILSLIPVVIIQIISIDIDNVLMKLIVLTSLSFISYGVSLFLLKENMITGEILRLVKRKRGQ